MSLFKHPNPFHRTILGNRELFVGEKHLTLLKRIKDQLKRNSISNQSKSFIISGDRGVGKSSLLKIISSESTDYNAISVNLTLTDKMVLESSEFFFVLFKQVIASIEQNLPEEDSIDLNSDLKNIVDKSRYIKFLDSYFSIQESKSISPDELASDFKNIISLLRSNKDQKQIKIIICIDESHKMYNKKDIIELIRVLIEKAIGVSFILCGERPESDSELDKVFGSIERGFEVVELNYFESFDDITNFFEKSLECCVQLINATQYLFSFSRGLR